MSADYIRNVLYRDDTCEVVEIMWEPGSKTDIHDHGNSMGMMAVLEGGIVEHVYNSQGDELYYQLHSKGSVVMVPYRVRHALHNCCYPPARTLHFYIPPQSDDNGGSP